MSKERYVYQFLLLPKRLTVIRHYSYECKAIAQERPYVSRPSRTQQLMNPKLVPKLTSDVPQELLRKKGVADELLAKIELERGRKRERQSEDPEIRGASKKMRSASMSSASVSTISTNLSRSPSPRESYRSTGIRRRRPSNISRSPLRRGPGIKVPRSLSRSPNMPRSPSPPRNLTESEKKRRRDSFSSAESYASEDRNGARDRCDSRSTRRRFQEISPPARGRTRTESRSPYRGRRNVSNDRQRGRDRFGGGTPQHAYRVPPTAPKERSLSPFSKRLALTQAMNMGRQKHT